MKDATFGLAPALSLLGLIAVGHLPLGLPPISGFVLPSIVMTLIYIWTMTRPLSLPPWLIFSLGILADVLSSGPIGYWSLYYLSTQAMALWFARNPVNSGLLLSWVGFLFTVLVVTFLSWAVATLYFMRSEDWMPMISGAGLVAISYPLIFWLSGASKARANPMVNEPI